MKRTIAGILLLMGLGTGTLFAEDGERLRRDIRRDEAKVEHERWEMRRDLYYGNYRGARHERKELERAYRDLDRDRRELYRAQRDEYWDRR